MREEVGTRLEDERRMSLDAKLEAAAAGVQAAPAHVRVLLRELPAHLALARSGGHALEGYRLNVLRVACDMSCTGAFQTLMSNAPLFELVNEAHATAELSLSADAAVQALGRLTALPTLLSSADKFGNRLFMGALYSKPADCVPLLQLAAWGGARLKVMEGCLKQLQARLAFLSALDVAGEKVEGYKPNLLNKPKLYDVSLA